MPCWHCGDTDRCDCIFCGEQASGGGWTPGPCRTCRGREEMDRLRPKLEAWKIDPRERKHWKRVGHKRDQGAPHLVFDPFNELRI